MVPVRRVTRERAARLGTYPVCPTASHTISCNCGSTLRTRLMTREAVARETPATRATSSRVGSRSPLRTRLLAAVMTCCFQSAYEVYSTWRALSDIYPQAVGCGALLVPVRRQMTVFLVRRGRVAGRFRGLRCVGPAPVPLALLFGGVHVHPAARAISPLRAHLFHRAPLPALRACLLCVPPCSACLPVLRASLLCVPSCSACLPGSASSPPRHPLRSPLPPRRWFRNLAGVLTGVQSRRNTSESALQARSRVPVVPRTLRRFRRGVPAGTHPPHPREKV